MTVPVPAGAGGVDPGAGLEAAARFVALCRPLEVDLVDSAIYALANLQCDISNGDGYDPKEYREDAWAAVAAVVEHLAWSDVAAALAAAEQRADTLAAVVERVRDLHQPGDGINVISMDEKGAISTRHGVRCLGCSDERGGLDAHIVEHPCPTLAALSSRPVQPEGKQR